MLDKFLWEELLATCPVAMVYREDPATPEFWQYKDGVHIEDIFFLSGVAICNQGPLIKLRGQALDRHSAQYPDPTSTSLRCCAGAS